VTRSYMCHDSFVCVPWRIDINDMTHVNAANVTWLMNMCAMTHFYVCYDASTFVTWRMNIQQIWRASFICVPWLISMCTMTHLYLWYASCICSKCDVTQEYVIENVRVQSGVRDETLSYMRLIHMCAMTDGTHSYIRLMYTQLNVRHDWV